MRLMRVLLFVGMTALISVFVAVISLHSAVYSSSTSLEQTSTPVLTLTPAPETSVQALNDLIADEDCQLPCWWGLVLGEAELEEVESSFRDIFGGDNVSFTENDQYWGVQGKMTVIVEEYPEPWLLEAEAYNFSLSAFVNKSTQNLIQIDIRVPLPQYHRVDWTALAPETILQNYGIPDEVAVIPPLSIGGRCCMEVTFRYVDLGLYIHYSIVPSYMNNRYTFCNGLTNLSFDGILLWIETEELEDIDLGLWEVVRYGGHREKSIEEISDQTAAEFTSMFSQEAACITTSPVLEWPSTRD